MFRPYTTLFLLGLAACGSNAVSPPATDAGALDAAKDGPDASDASAPDAGPKCGAECDGLAVKDFYAGDATRDYTVTSTAWKDYGDNLDGLTTTPASSDVCQRTPGAPSSVQADGTGGIDNSFGSGFVPIVQSLTGNPDISFTGSTQIGKGKASTSVFAIDGSGKGTATTRFFSGLPLGKSPAWSGADEWPIADESVTGQSLLSPVVSFPKSTLDGTTFDSGPNASGPDGWVLVQVETVAVRIPIHKMRIHGTLKSGSIDDGIISGIIKTDELIAETKRILGTANQAFCSGSVFDGIATQIKQLQDIRDDGTQDPGKPCNAISIGLGFSAQKVRLGAITPTPTLNNPCP